MHEVYGEQARRGGSSKQVATWLLIGVGMIVIQVLLGGITRLTESGLSITEWKPVTGILPPMNEAAWMAEFDKYKLTDQFRYVHQNFNLSDFKSIFFWEWFHRVWARLMGIVFLVGFVYFLIRGQFKKQMILPMVILFILGALQGLVGWLMVKSGLVPERYFVGHIELATHFIAALVLLAYTLWFSLSLLVAPSSEVVNIPLRRLLLALSLVLFFQLIYGAFMAGMHAAVIAPTWPDINGQLLPGGMGSLHPLVRNLAYNPVTVHFIHRGLAYLFFCLVLLWWFTSRAVSGKRLFSRFSNWLLLLVCLQLVLGILTVLNADHPSRLVVLAASHQITAMSVVMVVISLLFLLRPLPLRR